MSASWATDRHPPMSCDIDGTICETAAAGIINGTLMSLLWIAWGIVCFLSGAYLLGPAIYHRQLLRMVKVYAPKAKAPELSPEEMQLHIAKVIGGADGVDPRK